VHTRLYHIFASVLLVLGPWFLMWDEIGNAEF